jgi:carbon storage regulator CsrA
MLVLTRRVGEELVIDKQIRVVVAAIRGNRVNLSISAPQCVHIRRHELAERPPTSPVAAATGARGSRPRVADDAAPV